VTPPGREGTIIAKIVGVIRAAPEPMAFADIVRATRLPSRNVSKAMAAAKKHGFIESVAHPSRRSCLTRWRALDAVPRVVHVPLATALLDFDRRGLLAWARAICLECGASLEDVLSDDKHKSIAAARAALYAALLERGQHSPAEIGRMLNRDRTSVLSGAAAHRARQKVAA